MAFLPRPTFLPQATTSSGPSHAGARLLALAGITINGKQPWDIWVHHPHTLDRVLSQGSLGLGESYVDGWWDCDAIDQFIHRVLDARLEERVTSPGLRLGLLRARLLNRQSTRRAWQVGRDHYDLGNPLFEAMLDSRMAYSCGYWSGGATDLESAQEAKLDLVCRKLGLRPGMRLLDIGCGWGSLMRHAAERYGVSCVGLTVSAEQARWGEQHLAGLPVTFHLADYRSFPTRPSEKFDRVASIGMFEHVGRRNYRDYFSVAARALKDDGLFLLHTIGRNARGGRTDPWVDRYIFPNGELPSASELAESAERNFVIEDWHSFGADYDRTLLAWHTRFEAAWPALASDYSPRFRRLWRYYLLACAGSFRARANQLWQVVLSPRGVPGGYRRPA